MLSFDEFFNRLTKDTYIYRMARAVAFPHGRDAEARTGLSRSGRTRMRNAQRRIDDLVLQRALAIADERRCAAVHEIDNVTARCEYQGGHHKIYGRRKVGNSLMLHDTTWDHAAPSLGVWWMDGGS